MAYTNGSRGVHCQRLENEDRIANAFCMVVYTMRKAVEPNDNDYAAEMADESVKVFVRQLVQAHRQAGHLTPIG